MMQFDFLKQQPGLLHLFSTRLHPPLQGSTSFPDLKELSDRLIQFGFHRDSFVEAEQIHGDQVAIVTREDSGKRMPQADGLVTRQSGVSLVIRTADCAPVFLFDPINRSIGLVHSGKKGTELDIVTRTLHLMQSEFGCKPSNLMALLGPCIRPPDYEIDFASEIVQQLRRAGVLHISDCRLNTASDLNTFYSYRMEEGHTGRHYSLLALNQY